MTPELRLSLDLIRSIMPQDEPWWIIGSTALCLSGVDIVPKDVDVFASSAVIEAARVKLNATPMPPRPDGKFRSNPYFQHTPDGGVEIDFMGDLEVFSEDEWSKLQIESKVWIEGLPLPSLEDQAKILYLFGRDKDLKRIALIGGAY
ncbi:hypothetical protein PQU92_01605 [Asticcacaulis sp. BYS171W]|uniref:Nucleotidyltransferase AbiEii toxin of type IV toxin-antitoxin system n=1 Tax=Asticcacaulis aquaticus TaxID=2984212 RepID=A0ABT5HPR7_9CAUL|nr:hypothetical protein [Asticcacaulis aquaticus]MDC7681953.1 hypothetical protein [Asticcacaulis aquaticus]